METHLEYIESMLADSADKHAKDIEAAKSGLGDLHAWPLFVDDLCIVTLAVRAGLNNV